MRAAEQRRIRKLDRWRRRQGLPPMTPWWWTDRSPAPAAWEEKAKAAMFGPEPTVENTREQELEDFARLGPLTRQALRECLFVWSASNILLEIGRRGWRTRRDDAEMAQLIREMDRAKHQPASCFATNNQDVDKWNFR